MKLGFKDSKARGSLRFLLFLATCIGFWIVLSKIDSKVVIQTIATVPNSTFVILLVLAMAQISCQSSRLWCLLPEKFNLKFVDIFKIHIKGQATNLVFPARFGDFLKINEILKACRTVDPETSAIQVISLVMVRDKIFDIATLVILVTVFAPDWIKSHLQTLRLAEIVAAFDLFAIVVLTTLLISIHFLVSKFRPAISDSIRNIWRALTQDLMPEGNLTALGIGFGAWFCEAAILTFMTNTLHIGIGFPASFIVLAILNLGIAIPISPGNIGVYETALAFGLTQFGVPLTEAIVCAIFYHLIQISSVLLLYLTSNSHSFVALLKNPSEITSRDKESAIQYFKKRSLNYSKRISNGPLARLRNKEESAIVEFFPTQQNACGRTSIDIGCGDGKYSKILKKIGLNVTAVDINFEMVEQIKPLVDHAIVADIEQLQLNVQYDYVLCLGVLDFVIDPALSFQKLTQLVKPGGKLILSVPRKHFIFGNLYRLEKLIFGFKVNLFSIGDFKRWTNADKVTLIRSKVALPHNMVLEFLINDCN